MSILFYIFTEDAATLVDLYYWVFVISHFGARSVWSSNAFGTRVSPILFSFSHRNWISKLSGEVIARLPIHTFMTQPFRGNLVKFFLQRKTILILHSTYSLYHYSPMGQFRAIDFRLYSLDIRRKFSSILTYFSLSLFLFFLRIYLISILIVLDAPESFWVLVLVWVAVGPFSPMLFYLLPLRVA